VRDHVVASGLSTDEICKRTQWSEQKLSRLLRGKTALHAEHIEVLARIVKRPVAALYRGLAKTKRAA
jgi:transcriptional regulator with XRE-family HTH domain